MGLQLSATERLGKWKATMDDLTDCWFFMGFIHIRQNIEKHQPHPFFKEKSTLTPKINQSPCQNSSACNANSNWKLKQTPTRLKKLLKMAN